MCRDILLFEDKHGLNMAKTIEPYSNKNVTDVIFLQSPCKKVCVGQFKFYLNQNPCSKRNGQFILILFIDFIRIVKIVNN